MIRTSLKLTILLQQKANHSGLLAYCDADYAGDEATARSTTGYAIFYAGAPVAWKSKLQGLVTLSSTEAELVSLCAVSKEIVWIRRVAQELKFIDKAPTRIMCDNQSAIHIYNNERVAHRTRHMNVQVMFSKEQVYNGETTVEHTTSNDQLADLLTKGTTNSKFKANRDKMMRTMIPICLVIALCMPSIDAQMFEHSGPMVWHPTDYYVQEKVTAHRIEYTFINTCDLIPTDRTHKYAAPDILDAELNMNQYLKSKCIQLWEEEFLNRIISLSETAPPNRQLQRRQKRFVFLIPLLIMASGIAVSNLVQIGYSYLAPGSSYNRLNEVDKRLNIEQARMKVFEENFNLTKAIQLDSLNKLEDLSKVVFENRHKIEGLTQLMPQIAWFSTHMQQRIYNTGALLRGIKREYAKGLVATHEMAELLNMTELTFVDSQDTHFKSVSLLTNHTVLFTFNVKVKSPNTFIYKVFGFPFWENATDNPVLKRYSGPEYIMYNETNNCLKGITDPMDKFIDERCMDTDGLDPRVLRMRNITESDPEIVNGSLPIVQKTKSYSYIYCYRNNITILEKSYMCPPYTIRIPIERPFSVRNHTHDAEEEKIYVKMNEQSYAAEFLDPSARHRIGKQDDLTEAKLIESIWDLKQRLKSLSTASSLNESSSATQTTFINIALVGGIAVATIGVMAHAVVSRWLTASSGSKTTSAEGTAPSVPVTNYLQVNYENRYPALGKGPEYSHRYDVPERTYTNVKRYDVPALTKSSDAESPPD